MTRVRKQLAGMGGSLAGPWPGTDRRREGLLILLEEEEVVVQGWEGWWWERGVSSCDGGGGGACWLHRLSRHESDVELGMIAAPL